MQSQTEGAGHLNWVVKREAWGQSWGKVLPLYLSKGRTGLKVVDSLWRDAKTLPWDCPLWRRGWCLWDGNPWPGAILLLLRTRLEKLSVTDGLLNRETSCLSVIPQTPEMELWKHRASLIWGFSAATSITLKVVSQENQVKSLVLLIKCRYLLNLNLCGHYQIICIWTSSPDNSHPCQSSEITVLSSLENVEA